LVEAKFGAPKLLAKADKTLLFYILQEVCRMTKNTVLNSIRIHKKELEEKFTVRRIGVFGSLARDDADRASDVDILVEFDQPTFDHYMDLKFFLEQLLNVEVDLVMADTVKPRLRP
jgi:predicted nucleotidyltransferase